MFQIFAKADKVIAWLGDLDPDFDRLIQKWKAFGDLLSKAGVWDHDRTEAMRREFPGRDILQQILQRAWFSRTWVRQEVYAAERLYIVLGTHSLPFSQLVLLVKTAEIVTPQLRSFHMNWPARKLMYNWEYPELPSSDINTSPVKTGSRQIDLTCRAYEVLYGNAHFDATDDRDRIFALIGMIDEEIVYKRIVPRKRPASKPLPVSYDSNLALVYANIIKYMINADRSLRCLEVLGNRGGGWLPYWAFDWRHIDSECSPTAFNFFQGILDDLLYSSDSLKDQRALNTVAEIQSYDAPNVLRLKGYRMGPIYGSESLHFKEPIGDTAAMSAFHRSFKEGQLVCPPATYLMKMLRLPLALLQCHRCSARTLEASVAKVDAIRQAQQVHPLRIVPRVKF